jgi:hypothetical protein
MRVLPFVLVLAAASCLPAGDPPAKDPGSSRPLNLAAPDVENAPDGWCHLRGRVVFDGARVPERAEIPKAGGARWEDWVVDPANRGVRNVVVWLAPEPTPAQWEGLKARGSDRRTDFPSFPPAAVHPSLPVLADVAVLLPDRPRAFAPHVAAVRAGSSVVVQNATGVAETVKWSSRNNGAGNRALPAGGQVALNRLAAERFPIDIESANSPSLKCYVRVFDHPYFAVTGPDGRFEIRYAPKGDMRLFVWQETAGYRTGAEGRFGEPIKAPSGQLDLGDLKLKER